MAILALSYIVCLLALLAGGDGPRGAVPVLMTWIACAGGVAGLLLWVWRWPTRAQSVAFAVTLNTGIALACLVCPNPLAGIIGCIAFATSGAYIAFFLSTGLVLYNFVVAAAVAATQAARLAASGHPTLAGVDLWLVVEVNIALPVAIHVLIRAVAGDLLQADQDPLTNLLNRRAFNHKILGLITTRRTVDAHLVVLVIDLDNFKALNDSHGHAAGDQALVDVAHRLQTLAGDYQAALARSGGEEFFLAAISPTCNAEALATQVCAAVATSPSGVTSSVGTACALLVDDTRAQHRALLKDLITAGDIAMYRAKRRGGNQSHHHGLLRPSQDLI
ncbi:GGDEF domain-containing protein [Mycobacterium sp. MUNTM1]